MFLSSQTPIPDPNISNSSFFQRFIQYFFSKTVDRSGGKTLDLSVEFEKIQDGQIYICRKWGRKCY